MKQLEQPVQNEMVAEKIISLSSQYKKRVDLMPVKRHVTVPQTGLETQIKRDKNNVPSISLFGPSGEALSPSLSASVLLFALTSAKSISDERVLVPYMDPRDKNAKEVTGFYMSTDHVAQLFDTSAAIMGVSQKDRDTLRKVKKIPKANSDAFGDHPTASPPEEKIGPSTVEEESFTTRMGDQLMLENMRLQAELDQRNASISTLQNVVKKAEQTEIEMKKQQEELELQRKISDRLLKEVNLERYQLYVDAKLREKPFEGGVTKLSEGTVRGIPRSTFYLLEPHTSLHFLDALIDSLDEAHFKNKADDPQFLTVVRHVYNRERNALLEIKNDLLKKMVGSQTEDTKSEKPE